MMAAEVFGLAAFGLLVAFAFIVFALRQVDDPGDQARSATMQMFWNFTAIASVLTIVFVVMRQPSKTSAVPDLNVSSARSLVWMVNKICAAVVMGHVGWFCVGVPITLVVVPLTNRLIHLIRANLQ